MSEADLTDAIAYVCWKGNQRWQDVEGWTAAEIVKRCGAISEWVRKENEANKPSSR